MFSLPSWLMPLRGHGFALTGYEGFALNARVCTHRARVCTHRRHGFAPTGGTGLHPPKRISLAVVFLDNHGLFALSLSTYESFNLESYSESVS